MRSASRQRVREQHAAAAVDTVAPKITRFRTSGGGPKFSMRFCADGGPGRDTKQPSCAQRHLEASAGPTTAAGGARTICGLLPTAAPFLGVSIGALFVPAADK